MQYLRIGGDFPYELVSWITLPTAFYALEDCYTVTGDEIGTLGGGDEYASIDNASYSSFMASDLGSEIFEMYKSCFFLDTVVGPPGLMIPVSALTTTTISTVQSSGNYSPSSLKPASPIVPILPPLTSISASTTSVPQVEHQTLVMAEALTQKMQKWPYRMRGLGCLQAHLLTTAFPR